MMNQLEVAMKVVMIILENKPVLHQNDVEADSLALYESCAPDYMCMGNMLSDTVDVQRHGTNGSDNQTLTLKATIFASSVTLYSMAEIIQL